MTEPRFDGTKIMLGGEEFIVPPINFKQLKALKEDIVAMKDTSADNNERMIRVIHAALSRNYELTIDQVEEMIDLGNIMAVTQAVMGGSGFQKTMEGILAGSGQSGT
jgi:hypothetical protein